MTKGRPDKRREDQLKALREMHGAKCAAIRSRLEEFSHVSPRDYFYELLYCLLTPQTSAQNAERVVEQLRQVEFENSPIDPEPFLRSKSNYIRFHRTKANHLLNLKEDYPAVLGLLAKDHPPFELREHLLKQVKGIGLKEATHFLRNIGRNGGLAILDRHILRNLKRYGVIRSSPKSLTRKKYLSIERRFIRFSERIGLPIDELDLLFWSMETGEFRK
jgi:N-glycosylase/DNA lyase